MTPHRPKNLLKRNPRFVLSSTQFVGRDMPIDNRSIQVGDTAELKIPDDQIIEVVVESITGSQFTGKIAKLPDVDNDSGEFMGMKEDEPIEFDELHIFDFKRTDGK